MNICLDLPEGFQPAIERYVAQKFYDISPQVQELALLHLLIAALDEACILGRDEAIDLILKKPISETPVIKAPTPEPNPASLIPPATLTHPQPQVSINGKRDTLRDEGVPIKKLKPGQRKAPKNKTIVRVVEDVEGLKIPSETFQEKRSFTFITWGWVMSRARFEAIGPGKPARSKPFTQNDARVAIQRDLGIEVHLATLGSALKVLAQRGWLIENLEPWPTEYTISDLARTWIQSPANQRFLIDKEFIKESIA